MFTCPSYAGCETKHNKKCTWDSSWIFLWSNKTTQLIFHVFLQFCFFFTYFPGSNKKLNWISRKESTSSSFHSANVLVIHVMSFKKHHSKLSFIGLFAQNRPPLWQEKGLSLGQDSLSGMMDLNKLMAFWVLGETDMGICKQEDVVFGCVVGNLHGFQLKGWDGGT